MAQQGSRRKRKQRGRQGKKPRPPVAVAEKAPDGAMARGYARGRAKDEAARAALKPLAKGERPGAVTVGALAATALALANLVSLILGYDPDAPGKTVGTALGTVVLTVLAVGMWRTRYWAVLGMQTLLVITVILSSLALLTAVNFAAGALVLALVVGSGTLFWFLIKAMARIQMPHWPGTED